MNNNLLICRQEHVSGLFAWKRILQTIQGLHYATCR